jgi:hypothetical protein
MKQRVKTKPRDGIRVRGFYRLKIVENPDTDDAIVVGDSGWYENQVTNLGFNWYLAGLLGDIAGSSQVSYVAIGTGTVPGAAATTLAGEVELRTAVTAATSSNSKAVRFTATFTSAQSFVTTTEPISNIGLFRSLTVGTLFAGNTYASSNVATNQNVNITYDITFT